MGKAMRKEFYRNRTSHADPITRVLGSFLPRYRALRDLQAEPEELRQTLRNMILTHDHRLLYVRNQKAACTQTTQILYAYSNGGETYRGNVHRADQGFLAARYRWANIRDILKTERPFMFTFVRHPEKRLISAFKDFFVEGRNLARRNHIRFMVEGFGYSINGDTGRNFDAFLDYVEFSLCTDRMRTSTHFRPQVDNIGGAHLQFDAIGKVESYEADIRAIFSESGVGQPPPEDLLKAKFNATSDFSFVPSQSQRRRIQDIFSEDYERFGW